MTRNVLWSRASVYVCVSLCLCVCLSVRSRIPTLLHGPGCNLGSGRGCPVAVHYWVDLQSVHGLRCYGNITRTRNVSEYMPVLALCLVCVAVNNSTLSRPKPSKFDISCLLLSTLEDDSDCTTRSKYTCLGCLFQFSRGRARRPAARLAGVRGAQTDIPLAEIRSRP